MSFAVTPAGSAPSTVDAHVLRFFLDQRLRGEHMLHFRRADAVGERPERAMRRCMAIAADDGRARQCEALLRADDVNDALARIQLVVVLYAELGTVLGKRVHLECRLRIVDAVAPVGGRDVVIDNGQRLLWRMHTAARYAQALERLRARYLMNEVTVDIKEARAIGLRIDDVIVPDFIVKCSCHGLTLLGSRERPCFSVVLGTGRAESKARRGE